MMSEPSAAATHVPPEVYAIHEKLVSVGNDYWIEKGGQPAFKVDGKALAVRETLILQDAQGREVATLKKKLLSVRPTMTIERAGERIGAIQRAIFSPLHEHFTVEMENGTKYEIDGDITDHQYIIERDGNRVAEVSRKWLSIRDTYGVGISSGEDHGLILASVVAIDRMTDDSD